MDWHLEKWQLVALGCAGGLIPDLIRVAKSRYETTFQDYLKRPNFWIGLAVLVALGGLAAVIGQVNSVPQALIYGYAAPELFSRIAAEHGLQPKAEGQAEATAEAQLEAVVESNKQVDPRNDNFNVRRWWSQ
jgi:hypothetical protein